MQVENQAQCMPIKYKTLLKGLSEVHEALCYMKKRARTKGCALVLSALLNEFYPPADNKNYTISREKIFTSVSAVTVYDSKRGKERSLMLHYIHSS